MNESHNPPGEHHNPELQSSRCHFIVSDGVVTYCEDCTHAVRGSFPLEPWEPEKVAYYESLKLTGAW